ncbi:hypothetical protein WL29_08990 [Burkholderia ubonensis]|uniref:Uncharacterized protein n=1 Tax=Burkholderia ubonensis TaxID=101571 RepID=A0A103AD14_9BURK|nr:hypothetical protein WI84_28260 [Burkholderia ubonensis]KVP61927.1 hypothetical protein WJ91_03870 [Burkholderia ubonensis]KVP74591.1 hypothetical protein WJ93_10055 [Burkholderia ubonensis]KVW24173.1 hypothetical protein WK94_12110 [Burkholderia ubonensis]KWA69797.1 hypothetical protein WL29_08990 [Burkholderia ubonensis]
MSGIKARQIRMDHAAKHAIGDIHFAKFDALQFPFQMEFSRHGVCELVAHRSIPRIPSGERIAHLLGEALGFTKFFE